MNNNSISCTLMATGNGAECNLPSVSAPIEIYADGSLLNDLSLNQRIAMISAEPKMPKIEVRNILTDYSISVRLTIEYSKKDKNGKEIRKWNDHYPSEMLEIPPGESYNWDRDFNSVFKNIIRGGTGLLEYRIMTPPIAISKTFKFLIRGINPDEVSIRGYLSSKGYLGEYWFFMKLLKQESSLRQFKTGSNYSETTDAGLPVFGTPKGYGIAQIDNYYSGSAKTEATDDEVWNWKHNIDRAKKILDRILEGVISEYKERVIDIKKWKKKYPKKKIPKVENTIEGNVVFGSIKSDLKGIPKEVNDLFEDNLLIGISKSFIDASVIKGYNGAVKHYHVVRGVPDDKKAYWDLNRYYEDDEGKKHYYVEDVCSHEG